ncbi:MAG TPA: lysozyme inhibitor LprI family protein [Trinickia sp.]
MSADKRTKRTLLLLACLSASASASLHAQTLTAELAERAGMRPSQVTALLATCDASQTSMKFCAWRDQLAAERTLQRAIDEKRAVAPQCAAALEQKVDAWRKRRDAICRESAESEWSNGSMLSAAIAMCATDRTKQMTRIISAQACP